MRIHRQILFIYLTLGACTTNKIIQNNRYSLQDSVVDKWTHAVIHIQSVPSNPAYQSEIWEMYLQKKISWEAYTKMLNTSLENEKLISGTGIFFWYKEHYFLITARHVLANSAKGDTSSVFPNIILVGNSNNIGDHYQDVIDKTGRVATKNQGMIYLMNLSVGPLENRPYILSSTRDDLGVISISNPSIETEVIATLLHRGYRPITLSDIDTILSYSPGQQIMAIGFPVGTGRAQENSQNGTDNLKSVTVTIPFITHGIISKTADTTKFFEGDILINDGTDGAPIISRNKLVGMVVGNPKEERAEESNNLTRQLVNHSSFLKSREVLRLIGALELRQSNQ